MGRVRTTSWADGQKKKTRIIVRRCVERSSRDMLCGPTMGLARGNDFYGVDGAVTVVTDIPIIYVINPSKLAVGFIVCISLLVLRCPFLVWKKNSKIASAFSSASAEALRESSSFRYQPHSIGPGGFPRRCLHWGKWRQRKKKVDFSTSKSAERQPDISKASANSEVMCSRTLQTF